LLAGALVDVRVAVGDGGEFELVGEGREAGRAGAVVAAFIAGEGEEVDDRSVAAVVAGLVEPVGYLRLN
jgi:hypothetical protein